jgi:amino acid transporter
MNPHVEAAKLPPGQTAFDAGQPKKLTGTMSTLDIVFTVLAFNAPLSVFVGYIPVVIAYGNGIGAPTAFLGAGVLVMLFAVGFTAMSRHLSNPGAFYAYITAGLGKPLGLGAAFVAIVSYIFLYIAGLVFGGISLEALIRDVFAGPDLPWWLYTLGLITLVAILGYFRITLSSRILTATMILEVIIITVWDTVAIASGGPEGVSMTPFEPANILSGSVGLAALYGVTMFSGFEATAVFREEARDPDRTIPRATYITILVVAVMYAVTSFAIIMGVGPSTVVEATAADPAGVVLQSVSQYLGKITQDIVIVLLCTSIFAANLATHNVTARYLYSLSVDRVFPKFLSKVHASHGSPHTASLVTSGIAVAFLAILLAVGADGTTVFALLGGIAGYSLILLLLLTSCAVAAYFWLRRDEGLNRWKTLVAPLLAAAGLLVALILATQNAAFLVGGSEPLAVALISLFYGLLGLGVVLALVYRTKKPQTYARIGRQDL